MLTCSPWKCDINTLLCMLRKGDDLLLIQDGVLAAVNNSYFSRVLIDTLISISALKADLEARGLIDQLSPQVSVINYIDFVNLTIKHTNQMHW